MLISKTCREHASKCIETAKTLPPRAQREMYLDMATQWADIAARIEGAEALADTHRRLQTIQASLIASAHELRRPPLVNDCALLCATL